MRASHRNAQVTGHELAQEFAALQHRDTLGACRLHFDIVIWHRRRAHHQVSARHARSGTLHWSVEHILGAVANENDHTGLLQAGSQRRELAV